MVHELLKGFEAFRKDEYEGENPSMPQLVEAGQSPKYFVISCIDSRANAGTIFRAKPGTFFAHKSMGAIVRPYVAGKTLAASLQFALEHCGVSNIIIVGHTQCGAVQAMVDNSDDEEIRPFLDSSKVCLEEVKRCCNSRDELLAQAEKATILQSAKNLETYPSVRRALAENRLDIKTWLFDMKEGQLLEYDTQTQDFKVISHSPQTEDTREHA